MMDFLKRFFGGSASGQQTSSPAPAPSFPAPQPRKRPTLEPLPQSIADEFLEWFKSQRKPAIALLTTEDQPMEPMGSRLLGPAFLLDGEQWPTGSDGKSLEFLAQINLADCQALEGYPADGIVQFFVGRGDTYGLNFDDLNKGNFIVRLIGPDAKGRLQDAPHAHEEDSGGHDDYSPAWGSKHRLNGIKLVPELVEDMIDLSHHEAADRFYKIPDKYDVDPLYDQIDEMWEQRCNTHHTGGYPAFVQADIREDQRYRDYDHVLLRLTSDDHLMWGDAGECVFMIRSDDLAKGDFSKVIYSWDCS
ncbi:MAG: DUF1963 domain-containing protein [Pseudomonadota bacterium]|nr:DUF1963 domain-containing protein [Pseudomonadota bacterium]